MLVVSGVAFWYCFVNIRVFGAILCCVFFMLVLSGVAFCFFFFRFMLSLALVL